MGLCKFESMDAFMKELDLKEGGVIYAAGCICSMNVSKKLEPSKYASENMHFKIVKDSDGFLLKECIATNSAKTFSADEDMFFYDSQEKFLVIGACRSVSGGKWEMQYCLLSDVRKR